MSTARQRGASLAAVALKVVATGCLAVTGAAGGCARAPVAPVPARPVAAAAPAEPQGAGPLWRARQLLDQELERGRRRLAQGLPVRAARLAHLRLTQDALEQIDRGHLRRASDLLERAIAADGETGFAYLYLGKLYLDRGLTEEGLLLLERAAALLPRDRELERELRRLRAQAGESLTEPARSGG